MVEDQPAFGCFDRDGTRSDFGLLPSGAWTHDMAVIAPVAQIRTFAVIDVAEYGRCRLDGSAGRIYR